MIDSIPTEIIEQLSQARAVIERHLASTLQAIHLYGSALDGGLKPHSDIDLLVTVSARPDESIREVLLLDLLTVSAPPREDKTLRALEVTVIAHNEVVPWRYPARRELQFGEWLRKDLLNGNFEPAVLDIDLTILLTKARQHSITLVGPAAEELFEPVPEHDFFKVLADTLKQWNSRADWVGDERNIVLTVARIWYSAATGRIVPKDVAADWVLERVPIEYQPILHEARQAYLGHSEDNLAARADQTTAFILFAKSTILDLLELKKRNFMQIFVASSLPH
jgi:predicted nucleotidyltransferase